MNDDFNSRIELSEKILTQMIIQWMKNVQFLSKMIIKLMEILQFLIQIIIDWIDIFYGLTQEFDFLNLLNDHFT